MWPFPPSLMFYKSWVLYHLYPRKSQHHVEKYFFPSSAHVLLIYGAVCALIAGPGKKWDGSTAGPLQKDSLAFR